MTTGGESRIIIRKFQSLLYFGLFVMIFCLPAIAFGCRCATGLRQDKPARFQALRPIPRIAYLGRGVAPVPTVGANALVTRNDHFRILWGDEYNRSDPQWQDPENTGIPIWVATLAEALESAYAIFSSQGFQDPYGVDRYYLDVYVANTGIQVFDEVRGVWTAVSIPSYYYAYTEIDKDYAVAYFVFNNDFSLHSNRELAVLQATAAHELFHAVQRNDYPWDDDILVPNARWDKEMWWFEATATWMEEVCQPNVDDYVSYVQEFLTRPEEPLTSADGLREYGAAIFPGYLFEYHGGPALWQSVFQDIFELGVEKAITSALKQLNDQASLDEVVSAFWSCAARPEAFWSDGAKFKSYSSPKLLRSVATLPLEISTTYETTPGRYGANLFQLPTKSGSVKIEMEASGSNDSAWMISFSKDGVMEPVVQELAAGDPPIVLDTAEQEISYLAVVNVSDREGYPTYRAVIEDPAPKAAPNADIGNSVGGGGGGGCFISTVASGFSDIPFIARLFSKITKRAKKSERFDIQ